MWHALWSCDFARNVWRKRSALCRDFTGVRMLTYEIAMFGLCCLGRENYRVLWLLLTCVKEVWDTRNLYVFKREDLDEDDCVRILLNK